MASQFPFMHLSANEIDLQFQYRYANQVSAVLSRYMKAVLMHICASTRRRSGLSRAG
jgi:hypothetical protein